jgi:hypothetical protein
MSDETLPEPRTCYVVAKCSCGAEPPDEFADDEVILWLADHIGLEHVAGPLGEMLGHVAGTVEP